jgi:hypothetical protein
MAGGWVVLVNWILVFRWFFYRKRSSLVPVMALILGIIGILIMPVNGGLKWLWIIPFTLDVSNASLIYLPIFFFRRWLKEHK